MAIQGIDLSTNMQLPKESTTAAKDKSSISFSDYLKGALNEVNDLEIESQNLTDDFALGRTDNIHEVLIAGEKASLAVTLTMEIRNKVMDAYKEIMSMQV